MGGNVSDECKKIEDEIALLQSKKVMGILCTERPDMWIEMMRRSFCMGQDCNKCMIGDRESGTYGKCMKNAILKALDVVKDKVIKVGEPKSIKRYAVTYVEYGDSVDGKARILGLYRSNDEAHAEMKRAAEQYKKDLGLDRIEVFDNSASVGDTGECGCEYSIEDVNVYLYGREADEAEE